MRENNGISALALTLIFSWRIICAKSRVVKYLWAAYIAHAKCRHMLRSRHALDMLRTRNSVLLIWRCAPPHMVQLIRRTPRLHKLHLEARRAASRAPADGNRKASIAQRQPGEFHHRRIAMKCVATSTREADAGGRNARHICVKHDVGNDGALFERQKSLTRRICIQRIADLFGLTVRRTWRLGVKLSNLYRSSPILLTRQ